MAGSSSLVTVTDEVDGDVDVVSSTAMSALFGYNVNLVVAHTHGHAVAVLAAGICRALEVVGSPRGL